MQEDNIIVEELKLEYETVDVLEESDEVIPQETLDVIEVGDIGVYTVDTDEAFSALGEQNEQLKHTLLTGRELSDQHPITAITGLRDELDDIEALQVVYSDEKGSADYYEWEDGNPAAEVRLGYFVTVCEDIRTIKICDADTEIFGVTVDNAAFIGGQDDIERDYKYGLVAYSGIANVRCELDVEVGDNVISNNHGMAEKSDNHYGCKVIALNDIDGVRYATVSLDLSINQMDAMGQELKDFDTRMGIAELNIISATNTANEAYNLASNMDFDGLSQEVTNIANGALERADDALTKSENADIGVQEAIKISQEARAIANSLTVTAEALRTEAVDKANEAVADVYDLTKELEPLTSWDEDGNYSGSSYFAEYIKNGVATKSEIETAENKIEETVSEVQRSAKKIQTLVSTIDKYSVGEVSQANGLTMEQAASILEAGMIYVPTMDHSETYDDENSPLTQEFSIGYYYTWNGSYWDESAAEMVYFSKTIPAVGENFQYWFTGDEVDTEGYDTQTLYLWDNWGDEENPDYYWMAVDTLKDSARINSMITQAENEITFQITGNNGSINSIRQHLDTYESTTTLLNSWKTSIADENGKLLTNVGTIAEIVSKADEDSARIDNLVTWQGTTNSTLATIQQEASEDSARIDLVVSKSNGQNVVNAASIVTAVNGSDSSIKLAAGHINLHGLVTANNRFKILTDGSMEAVDGSFSGDVVAENFTATSGDDTRVEMKENQIKLLWNENIAKPVISLGYPTVSKTPYIVLGAGSNNDASDIYSGRFYVSKSSDGGYLSYYTGVQNGNPVIGSQIRLKSDCIELQAGNTSVKLSETNLQKLNNLLAAASVTEV
jgi:hypothetical protein